VNLRENKTLEISLKLGINTAVGLSKGSIAIKIKLSLGFLFNFSVIIIS